MTAIAFFNGAFVRRDEVHISPDDRGFVFADGVYEVIRAYAGRPFALPAHRARLARSLSEIRVDWPAHADLEAIVAALLEANELRDADAIIYLQVTRGAAPRQHGFPPPDTPPTVFASVSAHRDDDAMHAAGVVAVTTPDLRWARCDIKSVGLLPNVLAYQRAREQGAAEALFVRDGVVLEGTRTNLAAVRDGALITHPLTTHVLPGITRAAAIEVARAAGIAVIERPILESEIARLDEVMLLGTTMEVTAVTALDARAVGDGRPGPVARRLQRELQARLRDG